MALPWRLFPQPAPLQHCWVLIPLKPISSLLHRQAGKKKKTYQAGGKKTIKKNRNRTFLSSLPIINFFQTVYALFLTPP